MAGELDLNQVFLFNRTRAATISILALYVYEYAITLFDEIRYVWKHKYTFATCLFAFNRYVVWIEIALQLNISFGALATVDACTRMNDALSIIVTCHKLCIGLFCAFRIYAIWDREWTIFWTIMLLYIAHAAVFLTPNILSEYEPIGPPFYGCKIAPKTFRATDVIQLQLAASALIIASDTIILGLTVMRTMTISVDAHKFGFKTSVSSLLLRDGTVYFVALTLLSTINIVATKLGPANPIYGSISSLVHPLRTVLITRFFLNLRHVFFGKDRNGPESFSSIRVQVPTVDSDDLVGNLGAPLRSSFISDARASGSSYTSLPSWTSETSSNRASVSSLRPRRKPFNKGKARADPLLDWDVDDLDDEELEDMEIISPSPMLVGLEMDPNARGGGRRSARKKDFGGIGEVEEGISLVNQDGNDSPAQTPIQSTHPKGEGDRNPPPPTRQPSKSTVDEGDALLVDADENDEEGYSRLSMSTTNSVGREISPRRASFFS